MRFRALFAALAVILAIVGVADADGPRFPWLSGQVVDEAGILSPQIQDQISAMSAKQERATGEQIVVVTVKSLQGYSIEEFGYRLGRYWGIGQKGRDNGAILIIAPNEHKARIEAGYGLEGTLTDAQCRIIIEESILPAFRRDDFNGGVLNGMQAILQVLGGNPLSAEPLAHPVGQLSPRVGDAFLMLWCLIFFGVWGFMIVSYFRHRHDPRYLRIHRGYAGSSYGGGWSSGSSGGGFGGGFSGGGGSFGGGGASGSW